MRGGADDQARVVAALPRLKIFPLPGAVLLPRARVPLHVFEPRYRKMTRDCADSDNVLALACVAGSGPRVLPVVGAGILDRVEPLPDGRFNISLRGVLRARIVEEPPSGEPYRIVRAQPLLDEGDDEPAAQRAAEGLRRLLLALCAARPGPTFAALARNAARAATPGELADVAAAALIEAAPERQAVLEAVGVGARLELAMQAAATSLAKATPRDQRPLN